MKPPTEAEALDAALVVGAVLHPLAEGVRRGEPAELPLPPSDGPLDFVMALSTWARSADGAGYFDGVVRMGGPGPAEPGSLDAFADGAARVAIVRAFDAWLALVKDPTREAQARVVLGTLAALYAVHESIAGLEGEP